MAASSTDDFPTQLAALLGKRKVAQIRKTDENPPRISIIDVIATMSGKDKNQAAEDLRRISTGHPEVKAICFDFKFPGRGQRDTPVTDAKGIVEIIMLQTTKQAARVRRQAAELLCRYLGGDLALVDEVCRIRGFQEEMAVQKPEDPRRIFGEAVEATGGTNGGMAHSLRFQGLGQQPELITSIGPDSSMGPKCCAYPFVEHFFSLYPPH